MSKESLKNDKKANQMTVRLLFVSTYMLIATLPVSVSSLYLHYAGIWQRVDPQKSNKLFRKVRCFNTQAATNKAIHFYLY